jgi:flagellar basal-body rod protein FlgF
MLRGLYTAAAGMITQQRKHDTAVNNIANLNTPGFKHGVSVARSFPEMMIMLMNGGEGVPNRHIGRINTGVMVEETMFPILQGDVMETGKATDFALVSNIRVFLQEGDAEPIRFDASGKFVTEDGEVIYQPQAFFTVLNDQGERRFTRNGQFTINAAGELVTMNGYRVLGIDGEPIVADLETGQVRVNNRGQLYNPETGELVLNGDGEPIALLISQVDNPYDLVREGHGLFRLSDGDPNAVPPVADPNEIQVLQGHLERSTVDPIQTMTQMMMALRAYETNQRVIQMYDQTLDKAVNEIGRV